MTFCRYFLTAALVGGLQIVSGMALRAETASPAPASVIDPRSPAVVGEPGVVEAKAGVQMDSVPAQSQAPLPPRKPCTVTTHRPAERAARHVHPKHVHLAYATTTFVDRRHDVALNTCNMGTCSRFILLGVGY